MLAVKQNIKIDGQKKGNQEKDKSSTGTKQEKRKRRGKPHSKLSEHVLVRIKNYEVLQRPISTFQWWKCQTESSFFVKQTLGLFLQRL
jgi:hypothetical protein